MATGADVRDILELGGPEGDAASGTISKKDIINPDKVAGAFERAELRVKVLAKGCYQKRDGGGDTKRKATIEQEACHP